MDGFFNQDPANMEDSDVKMELSENNGILSVNVPFQNAEVVLMNHPASLTLYKYVSVTILSGTISVNGYEINKTIQIFSSEKTGLVEIKTESFENIWDKKSLAKKLEQKLLNLFKSDDICNRILQKFENSTVAVLIKRCALPPNIEFTQFYHPEAFECKLVRKSRYTECRYLCDRESLRGIPFLKFGDQEEKLVSAITTMIKNAKLMNGNFPRIIVCGPRNTGKSSLLQYLLNKMLSEFHYAYYYLDTDPGQPEFTPPGVVSLTRVEEPILGPPFFHQKRNSRMIFTGDVSPSFIDFYSNSIASLAELYNEKYSCEPLFVNTMGWVEGTGLQCLINTITAVKPSVLIEIVQKGGMSMFDYRDHVPQYCRYFQISCNHEREQKNAFSAKIMRELSLISYMGYCQLPYTGILPVNELHPYCVSWKKISIFIFPGGSVPPSKMVEAINESIVALCHVPETNIIETGIDELPLTLECDPENNCLAYGLVKAVDVKDNLLYVISPLKKDEWKNVNAIIKGNIMVPDAFILQQEIYNVPLPYTDVNEESETDEEIMDSSKLSLSCLSQSENEAYKNELENKKIMENFRKPIVQRYKRKLSKNSVKK